MAQGQIPYLPLAAPQVLDRHKTVSVRDRDAAHAHVAEVFCDHGLALLNPRGKLSMTLRSLHHGPVGLDLLDYGAAVRISPRAMEDFYLVQMPLAGAAEITVGEETVYSDCRRASIPPVERDYSMVWHAGTPQLILYARRDEVCRVAGLVFGQAAAETPELPWALDLATPQGAAFLAAVRAYHDDVNGDGAALAGSYARRLVQETLLTRLLLAGKSNGLHGTAAVPASRALEPPSRLAVRLQELIRAHAHEDLSALDIAQALGLPLRTLQHVVRRELDTTLSAMVRQTRLERCRSALLAADPATASVTEIALQSGFGHLSRFAASYRAAYGESPSETLRR
ncbi:AraC family transcriptional regulator [Arthrobacter sp. GCM10027362]|uniref:AraC family transcriptional regulator n=1 Tax=Arthrobacter sp. GCM10027362 TaxID=3273379 RepID=UPI003626ACCF